MLMLTSQYTSNQAVVGPTISEPASCNGKSPFVFISLDRLSTGIPFPLLPLPSSSFSYCTSTQGPGRAFSWHLDLQILVTPLIWMTFVYHFPLADKGRRRHSWKLLAQPLVLMLERLTLDSPLRVSSEVFQICCPQRSEDTEILLIYRLELKP